MPPWGSHLAQQGHPVPPHLSMGQGWWHWVQGHREGTGHPSVAGEMAPGSPTLQKGVTRGAQERRGPPQQHQQPWHPLILAHGGGGGEARGCYFL